MGLINLHPNFYIKIHISHLLIKFLVVPEAPQDVIKIYKADQTFKFIFVNDDTTAKDAVEKVCKEFSITENLDEYALYRVRLADLNCYRN